MTDRAALFGRDLALTDATGAADLATTPSGDLRRTTGEENIVQALRLRLRVRAGELAALGHPAYGSRLHELIGEPNTARTRLLLLARARSAVEQDPRVARVRSAAATVPDGQRDVVRLWLEVELISSPHPLNLVDDVRVGGVAP